MAKADVYWSVLIRGDNPAAKSAELMALVKDTPGCRVIRDMDVEGPGFIYWMSNEIKANPLRQYVGAGPKAEVQLQSFKASTAAGDEEPDAKEGSAFPFVPADDE
ncbi:hypothetical protein FB567DRAFT_589728 [Paraphoma chrysanthemicola]|uniref:Uncharacterized protein n=1 Tax=Paraphoma chrysanthemicola TaxID=798071 RepID=A0A8K0W114_9PLEO|nr:hypothetical protein FB567DRAFT_589728 [Paraphoma chrysanthemicola]